MRILSCVRSLFVALLLALVVPAQAQLTVSPQTDLQQLAAQITGPGVSISNPVITCAANGYGVFSAAGTSLGVDHGVILTSGTITNALGPNDVGNKTYQANTPGDNVLDGFAGHPTKDACRFEFDIIPAGDSLKFDFVFGSEEYNEWVGSQYNDVFGFFISGPGITGDPGIGADHNIALVPGTNTAVAINNINNGSNQAYYHDNTGGSVTQYDGYTVGLTARSVVTPCSTYHLKLIVADVSDKKYDSGVFINQVQSNNVTMSSYTANGTPEMVEGCNPGWVRFQRSEARPTPLVLQYYLQGTATNGTDYTQIGNVNPNTPKTITIPANQLYVDQPVVPLADGMNEGTEYLKFILGNPFCPAQDVDTLIFNIVDTLVATVQPTTATICRNDSVQFHIVGGSNYTWTPSTGVSTPSSANPWVHPASTTNYTVTVSSGTCSRTVTRAVHVSNLALSAVITQPLCHGGSNGAINLSVSNGLAPYAYAWTGPNGFTSGAQDINNLVAGTYTVTVTDAACTRTQNFNVPEPATLAVTATPASLPFGQNIACNGAHTGSISTVVTGGTTPYSAAWTGPGGFTSGNLNINALGAGNYSLSITDNHGCTASTNATLVESPAMSAGASTTANVLCFGSNVGSTSSSVSGGIPPYSYAWNSTPAQNTSAATGLPTGTYTVTVTDGYGCTATANTTVSGPAQALNTSVTAQTNVKCFGNNTGAVTIAITGGTAPYTTSWNTSPVQNGTTATGLTAGTWTATVTDANGCSTTRNVTITQPAAALSASLFSQTNVACQGTSSGSATVNASGGTAPYTFAWNTTPAQNTATANNLPAGTWTCTVRDVNNCLVTVNVTITQPAAALSGSISAQTNVACFGGNNGVATLSVSGGTAPYTYAWNTTPVQTAASATNLTAGTWTCTITDANGCTLARNATITQPAAALSTSVSAQTNVACFGNSTGSATINANGGTAPYTYAWNTTPVQTAATGSGLAAGTYTCTVTDAHGCTATRSVTITQPAAAFSASLSAQTDVPCFGGATGSATVNASGGTTPYTYSWNTTPVQTSATASALTAGTYMCTLTDAHGCTATQNVTITQPAAALGTSISGQTNVLCFGNSTGSATISVSGGTAPYTYAWNTTPVQSTASATGLSAGSYTCTITDAHGCTATRNVTITQPAATLSAAISAQTNVPCFGNSTGSATINASGGTAPYTYSWNTTPVQTAATATGLAAGSYTCTITDANGCSITRNVTISQPAAALSASLNAQTNVLCFGNSTGSASVNVSGGTTPYSYSWNTTPVQTSATASNLGAGTFTCTVTDAHGCSTTQSVTITQPAAALGTSISAQTNVLCTGNSTGSATVSASGGTAPYSYSWNTAPVQGTATTTNLIAGSYTCTVTDANGCTTTRNVIITQPAAALAIGGTVVPASCGGAATGAVDANVTGGTGAYTYSWTGPGGFTAASEDISNVTAGVYTLTVTDANGCGISHSFDVGQPGLFTTSGVVSSFTGGWNVGCAGGSNGAIDMTVSGGTLPYTHAWTGPNGYSSASLDITGLQAGAYTYVLTDANGCTTSASFTLTQPTAVTSTGVSSTPITCHGDANATIAVSAGGGTAPYSYAWSSSGGFTSNASSITDLGPDTYTLVVTDANGCTDGGTNNWTISDPPVLAPNASVTADVSCSGGTNGSAQANVSGGSAPYTTSWNTTPMQNGPIATGLSAGVYTVTVTDALGCVRTQNVSIAQPAASLSASISTQTNVACTGNSTGSATVSASGGTAPYLYAWNTTPTQTGATATGLAAGDYSCTVTDAHGCTSSATVTITEPAAILSASISAQTNVLCFGNSTGDATATAGGGTAPYSYSWNTTPAQNAATATGLAAGTWTCTITDAHGCSTTTSVTIAQPAAALTSSVSAQSDVACFGNSTGSASVSVNGGTPAYGYAWNTTPAQNTPAASGLSAGTWTCTITDANGCTALQNVIIASPAAALSGSITAQTNVDCRGNSTGSATAAAAGGTAPYQFDWNTPGAPTTATASTVPAGTWTCTITDAHGCSTSVDATITEPAAILGVTIGNVHQATCGNLNGQALAMAAGGTAPYTYAWNSAPPQGTAQLSGVGAGSYTVLATDAHGCGASAQVTISAPSGLGIALVSTTPQTCFGTANGQATVLASGGSGPYSYQWNTVPVRTGATASGMIAGTYTATVTDANGCTASVGVTITGPASPLTLTTTSITNVLCYQANSGAATVQAGGGLAPYAYTWNTNPVQTGASATQLNAGTYTATVTDAFGCTTSQNVTIIQPIIGVSAFVEDGMDETCFGANNGWATMAVSGGSGSYSITWNTVPVQTGATGTDLAPGLYTVTVTDNNGCDTPKQFPVVISGPSAPVSVTSVVSQYGSANVSCADASDGSIDITPHGGTAPYTFQWTDDMGSTVGSEDLTGLDAAIYHLSVSDAWGCTTTQDFTITAPAPITASANVTTAACQGAHNGAVDMTFSGGTPPFSFSWTGPNGFTASTEDITGLAAGVYQLAVQDANGCSATFSEDVSEPGVFTLSAVLSTYVGGVNVSCRSNTDGSIDLTAGGGTAPYSYQWSGPNGFAASTEDLLGLAGGTYALTLTDAHGCSALGSYTLVAPPTLTANTSATVYPSGANTSCNGAIDGVVNATLNGGTPAYTTQWTGPNGFTASTEDISGLAPGTYLLAVTDANGCTTNSTTTIVGATAITATASLSQYNSGDAVSCNGGHNGIIDLDVHGGLAPYTVAWSGPNGFTSNAQDQTGLAAGTYQVSITDAAGCTSSLSTTLTEPGPVQHSATTSDHSGYGVSCANSHDGSINLTQSGGAGNFTWQWTGPNAFAASTEDVSSLAPGTYVVVATDMNGCSFQDTYTLQAPAPLTAAAVATSAACQGTNSGALDLDPAGGVGPYTFAWSGPAAFSSNSEDLTDLYAGVYAVTITDANGCSTPSSFAVNEPGSFQITGSLEIHNGGYNVSCAGANDGSVDVTISGGTAPYFYSWNGPNGFSAITEDIADLGEGLYNLTLTDQNGCSDLATFSITAPTPIDIGLVAGQYAGGVNVSCEGSSDGSVNALINGGVTPYDVQWSGPNSFLSISPNITDLAAGSYAISVTDAIGCTASDTVDLVPPVPISIQVATSSYPGGEVSCANASDGSIDLTLSGGTLIYLVHWTGPNGFSSNNQHISGLLPGTYNVTVSDANGCSSTASVTLHAPPALDVNAIASQFGGGYGIGCAGASSGAINGIVSGGSGPVSYLWSGPAGFTSTSAQLTGLLAGTYHLQVTDSVGCSASTQVTLTQPTPVSSSSVLSDAGNGYQVGCSGMDGAISIATQGGLAPYTYNWTGDNGFASLAQNLSTLAAGHYQVTITDANGCTSQASFDLTQAAPLTASLAISGNVCDGLDDGAVDLTVGGGVAPYTYAWSGPNGFTSGQEDIAALAGGDYTVVITDQGNCTTQRTATIAASAPMDLSAYLSTYGQVNIPCVGDSTGVIEVHLTGGQQPLNVQWSGPGGFSQSGTMDLYHLPAGDYSVVITDANGCTSDSTFTLLAPSSPLSAALSGTLFPSGTNISCTGAMDGGIDLTVTGGVAPYTYAWRGPDSTSFSTEDISGLVAGTYDLVVTDTNQCSYTTSITLSEPDSALAVTADVTQYVGGANTSCSGSNDGSINVVVSGGSSGQTLSWSGPNGFTSSANSLSDLAPGTYTVQVVDMNGCSLTQDIDVVAPQPIQAVFTPSVFGGGVNLSCQGMNDGSLSAAIQGGTPGYSVQWSGPNGFTSTDSALSALGAGTYCMDITDANNCTAHDCIELIAPTGLAVSATASGSDCGGNAGSVDASVNGGTAPYAFAWSNGSTIEDLSGIPTGTYVLLVTDANGCVDSTQAQVNGSPALIGQGVVSDAHCHGSSDGSVDVTMTSGTAPYTFSWTGGSSSEDLNAAAAGGYQLTVTDAAGCTWNQVFTVDEPAPITVDTTIAVYGNGQNVSGEGAHDGSITLQTSGGTAPYTYTWSNGASAAALQGLAPGAYAVTITDANGCALQLLFTLDGPNPVEMPTGFTPNGDGKNDAYVIHGLDAYLSNQLIVFNRWGNVVFDQLNYRNDWRGENQQGQPLPDGTYFVILRLNDGGLDLQNYVDLRR